MLLLVSIWSLSYICIRFVFYSSDYKYNDECERLFHVSSTNINKNELLSNCETNDSSCFEIYSSVDSPTLFLTNIKEIKNANIAIQMFPLK